VAELQLHHVQKSPKAESKDTGVTDSDEVECDVADDLLIDIDAEM
jgi:hypothetical protein